MSGRSASKILRPQHADHLARFRIPPGILEDAGVRSVTDAEAREMLGVGGRRGNDLSGILFPYRSPLTGARVSARIRLDSPLLDGGGKYISEIGCRHLFFPPNVAKFLHDQAVLVILVESEKAALSLRALADRAQRPMLPIAIGGCWGWRRKIGRRQSSDGRYKPETGPSPDLDLIDWTARTVIIVFDSNALTNPDVQKARHALAEELAVRGASVFIAEVPALEGVNGPDDLIAVSGDDAMLGVLDCATTAKKEKNAGNSIAGSNTSPVKKSTATELIELAQGNANFFHEGESCYAAIDVAEHREIHALRSRGFRRWLRWLFFEQQGKAANCEALASAMVTLEGQALFQGEEKHVFIRVAESGGKIYLDLCNHSWQVVAIDKCGWRIIESKACPVSFRRPHGMLSLSDPESGGNINDLRQFLNVASDDDFRLAVAWVMGALHPRGPYPVLILHGEQGSAKTTAACELRALVDPNIAPVRSEPRDPHDLMVAANNGWACVFDNMSSLPVWLSDALCRLSTGGGFSTRQLYTDEEEIIFEAKRPVMLNGIEELATRGDLLDRCLVVYLPRIAHEKRQDEKRLNSAFEAARPRLLGALLDAVSSALSRAEFVKIPRLPRMADFTIWMTAAEQAFGWKSSAFLHAYEENRRAASDLPLETPVADALRKLTLPWDGTATELLSALQSLTDESIRHSRTWPRSGQSLSNALRRLAPNLREAGIGVEFTRQGHSRARLIRLWDSEDSGETSSAASAKQKAADDKDLGADDTLGVTSAPSSSKSNGLDAADAADDEKPQPLDDSMIEETL
jgi:hypothetical protein